MKNKVQIIVDDKLVGIRIDKVISSELTEYTRSYIQNLIKDNNITVNDITVKVNYITKLNDIIDILFSNPQELNIEAEDIPLSILYEDADVIVINKPKNMVVHPAPGHLSQTLVNALMFYCKDNLSGINGIMRPGIVHRIDKDTTGSIIVCKNDFAHQEISKQLQEHTLNRTYRAIVFGKVAGDGIVDAPIARHPNDRKKMAIAKTGGKNAITHYKLLATNGKLSYIECRLETGRTHQIRVHMASIGYPLVGDITYTNRKANFETYGQCLHAYKLGFLHPRNNEYIETIAPIPKYFDNILRNEGLNI